MARKTNAAKSVAYALKALMFVTSYDIPEEEMRKVIDAAMKTFPKRQFSAAVRFEVSMYLEALVRINRLMGEMVDDEATA